MNTADIVSAVLTGVGVIITSLFAYFKFWFSRGNKKEEKILAEKIASENKLIDGLQKTKELDDILLEIRERDDVESIAIFHGHNDGGYPKPSHRFYIDALYWKDVTEMTNSYRDFKLVPISSETIDHIIKMISNNYVILDIDNVDDCLIKSFYRSKSCDRVLLYYNSIIEKGLFFTAVAFSKENELREETIHDILPKLHKLTNLLLEY